MKNPTGTTLLTPNDLTYDAFFSLKLDKEYQQRCLLDVLVTGVKIQFERYQEQSLLLRGSVEKLRAWDPDMSRITSDRNRHLLSLSPTEDENGSIPFFSFHYRTFRTTRNRQSKHFSLPDWVEDKITSGDIDDFLKVSMRPLEIIHLNERTAELADYLNNGLPGALSNETRACLT